MIHEYRTARSVCSFVEICAWAGVVVGAIVMLGSIGAAFSSRDGILALIALRPAFSMLLTSFIVIILVQMARATMDGSVAAQKNVIQNQKQHEEVVRSLRSLATRGPAVVDRASEKKPTLADAAVVKVTDEPVKAPVGAAVTVTTSTPGVSEYKGHQIHHEGQKHRVEGIQFATIEQARYHIDSLVAKQPGHARREPTLEPPKGLG